MTQAQAPEEELDFDKDIKFVRDMRMGIIKELCNSDGKLPTDANTQRTALILLDQISKDAISIKKIKTEEKSASTMADKVANAARMLTMINPAEIAKSYAELAAGMPARTAPALPDDVSPAVLLPGEASTAVATESYTSFAARTGLDGTKNGDQSPD
jgi:hypothetical protein